MPRATSTPADKARVAARRQTVLEYVKAGLTYRDIAERLTAKGEKVSHVQVFKDFQHIMKHMVLATKASKEELVAVRSEQLEMVFTALVGKVVKGDVGAIKMWIKANESYRKLHGLDKPVKFEEVKKPPLPLDFRKLTLPEQRLLEVLLLKAQASDEEDADDLDDEAEED